MLPGTPSSPGLPPSSPGSPSLTNVTPLSPPSSPSLPPSSPGSSSLSNVTPLSAPGPSKKTQTVRSRPKLLQSNSQNFLDQLKLEASQRPRPRSPPVIPIMPTPKRFQSHETDSDGTIKKIKGQSKKYDINKLLKKQEQDELSKLLEKQKDELNK